MSARALHRLTKALAITIATTSCRIIMDSIGAASTECPLAHDASCSTLLIFIHGIKGLTKLLFRLEQLNLQSSNSFAVDFELITHLLMLASELIIFQIEIR